MAVTVVGAPEAVPVALTGLAQVGLGGVLSAHGSFVVENAKRNLNSSGGDSNTSPTPRKKTTKQLREEWEAETGEKWPMEPDNPNKPQVVSHKKALQDGGHDGFPNTEPKPAKEHHENHKKNGDYSRWRKNYWENKKKQ